MDSPPFRERGRQRVDGDAPLLRRARRFPLHEEEKAALWQRLAGRPVNERQRRVVNRLLDGFEGLLTTSKYGKLARCSSDTALRDIAALVDLGVLVKNPGGGRSTS